MMNQRLTRYIPAFDWLLHYQSKNLMGDITAGIIAASLLIPQSMGYALLAGVSPQVGLYTSIFPPIVYPLLGTSQVLAVGPVAVDSLMSGVAISSLAPQNAAQYLLLAATLAFLVGGIEIVMGLLRLGFLVNFLSRSVISGFISGAALSIALGQIKHILGFKIASPESFFELMGLIIGAIAQTNWATLGLGLASILLLLYCDRPLVRQLERRGWNERQIFALSKSAPLLVIITGTLLTWGTGLERFGVKVVGHIPTGLPSFTLPLLDAAVLQSLLPAAFAIALVGYLEGFAGGQALASRRREKIDANQELIALGGANVSAALSGGFPVTGGLSRSVVNFAAGANTGLASMITGLLIAVMAMFLTPLFYFLPQASLAAVIITAVYKLIDFKKFQTMWAYDRADASAWLATFLAVLTLGVQTGIILGAILALLLHLWRTSHPHIAIVGRLGDSEHFRNVLRYEVKTSPEVLAVRVDESLYFANAKFLENFISREVAQHLEVKKVLLVCNAVNAIDASALEILEGLIADLKTLGIEFYFSEVKGPVMDRLIRIGFINTLGQERFFLTTDRAMHSLAGI